tara:strand:+ start:11 stop:271 length:261 start_codon:yes stop_codon:yes gene_type:complete
MEKKKKIRKSNAQPLPEGLKHDMLPTYIVYYRECYNKSSNKWREFFKIEKHPKLTKPIIGTKSNKISILEKLKLIKTQLDILNQND